MPTPGRPNPSLAGAAAQRDAAPSAPPQLVTSRLRPRPVAPPLCCSPRARDAASPPFLPSRRSPVPYSPRPPCSSLPAKPWRAGRQPPAAPTRPPLISLLIVDYVVAAPSRGSAASAGICGERAMCCFLPPSTFPPDLLWWLPQWAAGDPWAR
jgi:hypothetical protein